MLRTKGLFCNVEPVRLGVAQSVSRTLRFREEPGPIRTLAKQVGFAPVPCEAGSNDRLLQSIEAIVSHVFAHDGPVSLGPLELDVLPRRRGLTLPAIKSKSSIHPVDRCEKKPSHRLDAALAEQLLEGILREGAKSSPRGSVVRWMLDETTTGVSAFAKTPVNLVAGGGFEPPTFGL